MVDFQCAVDGSTGKGSIQQPQRQRLTLHSAHSASRSIYLEQAAQKCFAACSCRSLGSSGLGRLLGCHDAGEVH